MTTTMKGQSMKQEEYYAAVRLLVETTPSLSIKAAIPIVAKRKRASEHAVQAGYYREYRKLNGLPSANQKARAKANHSTTRPTQAEILAKLQPIKIHTRVVDAKSANGNLRDAAIAAFDAYEDHLVQREADVAKREQQMDELRAKIATLV